MQFSADIFLEATVVTVHALYDMRLKSQRYDRMKESNKKMTNEGGRRNKLKTETNKEEEKK